MSAETPNSRDDNSIVQDLLKRLEHVRFDAHFRQILGMAEAAQTAIDALADRQWPEIEECLEAVRDAWEESGWNGTPATVSGRLRPSGLTEATGGAHLIGHEVRHDERGAYYQVDAITMSALGIIVDSRPDEELDEYHPVVFSLTPVDEYDDDLYGEDGMYIMYPDDIVSVEFRDQSIEAAEHNLKYYFPEVYQQVRKYFSQELASDRIITHALKRLEVTCDDPQRHGYDLIESLNLYIFSHIDFDSMGYQINFDGEVAALSEEDELVEVAPPDRRYGKLSPATICGVIMQPTEDDTYRPGLVVAVPAPQNHGGYEAYIVPADSLMDIRSLRPKQSQLGRVASYKFDDPEDVAAYFSGKGELFREEMWSDAQDDSEAERTIKAFVAMTEAIQHEMPRIVAYDERHRHYLVSIEEDLQTIADHYDTLVAGLSDGAAESLEESVYAAICESMCASLGGLKSLHLGDEVISAGATIVIDTEGDEQVSSVIETGESIAGRFCGFAVSQSPDLAMKITGGEAGGTVRDIAILLDDVTHIDAEGKRNADTFVAQHIAIPVNRDGEQSIFKVLHDSGDA